MAGEVAVAVTASVVDDIIEAVMLATVVLATVVLAAAVVVVGGGAVGGTLAGQVPAKITARSERRFPLLQATTIDDVSAKAGTRADTCDKVKGGVNEDAASDSADVNAEGRRNCH